MLENKEYYTLVDTWQEMFLAWKIQRFGVLHSRSGEIAAVSHPQQCGGTGWYKHTPHRKMTLEKAREELAIVKQYLPAGDERGNDVLWSPRSDNIAIIKVYETYVTEEVS